MKILNGDYTKDSGEIRLDGDPVTFRSPRDAHRAGIRVIYQELNDAPDLSAGENVLLGQLPRKTMRFPGSVFVDWRAAKHKSADVLATLNADFSASRLMRRLSVGQRQVVEIAKALSAPTPARVLVMDEPTAALTPREVDVLFQTIASLRKQGVGIIYISHRLDEIRQVAQRVMVLRDGNVAGVLSASEASREQIVRLMVGRTIAQESTLAPSPQLPNSHDPAALEVINLSRHDAFEHISFDVRPGETIGLFGLLGSGHLEVNRALFGIKPADSGEIRLHGKPVELTSPRKAKRLGIGLVPEDRKVEAIVPQMAVADNLMFANWPAVATTGIVSRRRQMEKAKTWISRLRVHLKSGPTQPIATLSGGNQQKVILARWLEAGIRILLLNEPTRGVDVGARADIYALLAKLREEGLAVIVASSDLEEVLEVSDRIFVFAKVKIVATFDRNSATQESLLAAAAQ